ncbi:MAG TPA: hemerythrin domain-containing protein [Rhizobacter sp.]|nr:hemerythrin domain-containing protein [Rhizobacter sp.]
MPTPKNPSSRSKTSDAIALLSADHKEVKALFKEFEKLCDTDAEDSEKQAVAEQICQLLTVHARIEEEIFYPAARDVLEEGELIDEAEVEHSIAKDLIAQIQGMQPEEALYDAKVTVLGEYIHHHVQEEEKLLFPKVKQAKLDTEAVGAELAARKEALMAAADQPA